MPFSDYDDECVAKALTEVEEISRLDVAQQAITEQLTRPYRLSARRPIACNVISLKARRDARKASGARR